MKLRMLRRSDLSLVLVGSLLVASCGDAQAAAVNVEASLASAEVQPVEAAPVEPVAEPAAPAAAVAVGGQDTRWGAPVLDTGVDLSKVKVKAKPAPAPAPAQASTAGAPDPRVQRNTFGGGAPTEAELQTPGAGYLTVSEAGALRDFGKLVQGDVVEHTFELATMGKGPVILEQIKSSCGCTVAQTMVVDSDGKETPYQMGSQVAPGSKLFVKAKLDTDRKRSRVRSVVTVMSNDPRGNLQLQLMADVQPFFELAPLSLNFGTLKPDQVVEKEIVVTSPSVDFFRLEVNEEVLPPELKVVLEPESPQADGRAAKWRAKVTLGPNIPEGQRRNYQIVMSSDQPVANAEPGPDGKAPSHQTVAYAVVSVLGLVSAEPHYMSFGLMREEQEVSRTVRVENHDDSFEMAEPTIRIEGYQGEFEYPDSASVTVTEVEAGKSYDVTMTMKGPVGLTGTFRGRVMVDVGHPTKPSLELPFTGVVRAQAPAPGGKPAGAQR